MVECLICGFEGKTLFTHIKFKHNLDVKGYKDMFNVDKISDPRSDVTLQKMSDATKKRLVWQGSPFKRMMADPILKKENSRKISKALTGKKQPRDIVEKRAKSLSISKKGYFQRLSKERQIFCRNQLSNGIMMAHNQNPEYYHKIAVENGKKGLPAIARKRFPNGTSIEQIVKSIITELNLPYKYTGNGSFWIENMNPDFVNCDGQKKVIEVLGTHWHDEKETSERTQKLKEYGFSCLPIWENELKNPGKVKEKILRFDMEVIQ